MNASFRDNLANKFRLLQYVYDAVHRVEYPSNNRLRLTALDSNKKIALFLCFFASFAVGVVNAKDQSNTNAPVFKFLGHPVVEGSTWYERKTGISTTNTVKGNPHYERYKSALNRFPNLASCRKQGFDPERNHITAHGHIFLEETEFEVCHFWYFSSFANQEDGIINFLKKNSIRYTIYAINGSARDAGGTRISAGWSTKLYPPAAGDYAWANFTYFLLTRAASLSIRIDSEDRVSGVRLNFTSW